MTVLDHLSVLEFRGPDAGQFLQAQLTADMSGLDDNRALFAACCNPAGRVLALLLVQRCDDAILAVCSAALAPSMRDWLGRFIFRAKVNITVCPDRIVCGLADADEPPPAGCVMASPVGRYALMPAAATGDNAADADAVDAWRRRELLAGISWLDRLSSGQFLPQMLGLENIDALSFRKGCYPGQEIIARTRYLGKLKRHPLLLRLESFQAPAGKAEVDLIAGEQHAGAVVLDQVALGGNHSLLSLVTRLAPGIAPDRLQAGDASYPVSWSAAPGPDTRLP